jgi:hypothetical protein
MGDQEAIENIKPLVIDAKCIYTECGRAANEIENLCASIELQI